MLEAVVFHGVLTWGTTQWQKKLVGGLPMKYNRCDHRQIFTKGVVLGGHETIISTSKTIPNAKRSNDYTAVLVIQ